jgi:cation diffusion facilitator family transporter
MSTTNIFNTKNAGIINLIGNIILFFIKMVVGLVYFNLSLISDALNSFLDIVNAVAIMITVKINNQPADHDHNFGHTRAESIAGYTTAILMFVLAFNIIKEAIISLLENSSSTVFNPTQFIPIVAVLVIKSGLFFYIKKVLQNKHSPALEANLQDHKNDIFTIFGVFLSIILTSFGFKNADNLISIFIALWIAYSGFGIAKENIDHLMGKTANSDIEEVVKKAIAKFPQIIKLNGFKSQYLGTKIQVEVFIKVSEQITMVEAHTLSHQVQNTIEQITDIVHCSVHLDLH